MSGVLIIHDKRLGRSMPLIGLVDLLFEKGSLPFIQSKTKNSGAIFSEPLALFTKSVESYDQASLRCRAITIIGAIAQNTGMASSRLLWPVCLGRGADRICVIWRGFGTSTLDGPRALSFMHLPACRRPAKQRSIACGRLGAGEKTCARPCLVGIGCIGRHDWIGHCSQTHACHVVSTRRQLWARSRIFNGGLPPDEVAPQSFRRRGRVRRCGTPARARPAYTYLVGAAFHGATGFGGLRLVSAADTLMWVPHGPMRQGFDPTAGRY
jgi:hypothetical protein